MDRNSRLHPHLDERAIEALREAQALRADRELLEAARGERLAAFSMLRDQHAALTARCDAGRRRLGAAVNRWARRWGLLGG